MVHCRVSLWRPAVRPVAVAEVIDQVVLDVEGRVVVARPPHPHSASAIYAFAAADAEGGSGTLSARVHSGAGLVWAKKMATV